MLTRVDECDPGAPSQRRRGWIGTWSCTVQQPCGVLCPDRPGSCPGGRWATEGPSFSPSFRVRPSSGTGWGSGLQTLGLLLLELMNPKGEPEQKRKRGFSKGLQEVCRPHRGLVVGPACVPTPGGLCQSAHLSWEGQQYQPPRV